MARGWGHLVRGLIWHVREKSDAGVVDIRLELMATLPDDWWSAVSRAVGSGTTLLHSAEEFDAATAHALSLLRDSSALLASGSHATAAFLAITAIEETVKIHIGSYRQNPEQARRGRDPLFQHAEKHRLAAAPTVEMGERLPQAIGEERLQTILEEARTGALVRVREQSLYFDHDGRSQQIPAAVVDPARARELLLFAIELFDDSLVGMTDRSMAFGQDADAMFERWREAGSERPGG